MVHIETNTQPEKEVREALVAHGYTVKEVVDEVKKSEQFQPAEEKPSKPVGEPGDKVPVETAGDATVAEVQEPTQETPPAPTQTPKPKEKAKGGFQVKVEKLTARVENLQEELDSERGDKTRISTQLAEAQEELKRLHGGEAKAEPVKEAGPVRPKRPVMPDMAEVDYDQEKYSAAVKQYRADSEKYETEMDAYNEAVTEKKVTAGIAAKEEKDNKARVDELVMEAQNAFVALKDKDAATYGDDVWAELIDNQPKWKEVSPILPDLIFESEVPGHLMMYLYEHPEELERLGEMKDRFGNPNLLRHTATISRIEDKLIAEHKSKSNGTGGGKKPEPKPAAAEAEPVAVVPPAKPKPKAETPEEPLRPVGARAGGGAPIDFNAQLKAAADGAATGDQNSVREFRRLRAMQHQEKQQQAVRAR